MSWATEILFQDIDQHPPPPPLEIRDKKEQKPDTMKCEETSQLVEKGPWTSKKRKGRKQERMRPVAV